MSQATIDRIKFRHGLDIKRRCEIAGCERDAVTDVPATARNGMSSVLVVCDVCANAYESGAKDPNAYK